MLISARRSNNSLTVRGDEYSGRRLAYATGRRQVDGWPTLSDFSSSRSSDIENSLPREI